MSVQQYDQFKRTTVPHGGQRVRGYIIECGNCGVTATAPINNFKDRDREESFVAGRFRGQGWKVGSKASQNRCPGCFAKIRTAAARNRGENNVVQLVPVNDVKPMGRDDRRIIFEKLNEVYVSEKVGYGDGWTDKKVAEGLGCPLAWVKSIRDEMFGPEGSNEQVKAGLAEAKSVLSEIKTVGSHLTAKERMQSRSPSYFLDRSALRKP